MTNLMINNYLEDGYVILEMPKDIQSTFPLLQDTFKSQILNRFNEDAEHNRALIKKFADFSIVRSYLNNTFLQEQVSRLLHSPVYTGPVVTHYTSNGKTGNGYGLGFHQDWPSMASSNNGILIWTCLNDCFNSHGHGLEIIPKSHNQKPAKGQNTSGGYFIDEDACTNSVAVEIQAGDFLLMSPWLIHRTLVDLSEPETSYKLSLSCRMDDLACADWQKRGFNDAYKIVVDRELWQNTEKNNASKS